MKKIFNLLLLLGLLSLTPSFYKSCTDGFRLGKILMDLPDNPHWETKRDSFFFDSQEFSYLDRGSESFVFISENGKYILKLFRKPPCIHPWRSFFRDLLHHRPRIAPQEKINLLLSGAKLAFDQARDLTGLVYVHLHSTKGLFPIVSLKDKIGRVHAVDLGRCRFAIQYRANSLQQVFEEALEQGDKRKMEMLFRSFAQLIGERASRGIVNVDPKVNTNFGYLDGQVIEWDFGCYCADPNASKNQEIDRFSPFFRHLLQQRSPELTLSYEKALIEAKQ